MNLRRDLVKYVRDKAKSKYRKSTECYICGSNKNLDFHHFYSLTGLLERWIRKHDFKINSAEEIMRLRDAFIEDHHKELFDDTITLCHTHHLKLHSIYGKKPIMITAKKQPRWAKKQRDKYGLVR